MPLVKTPFLPAINKKHKYSLVLDLDETLIHYINNGESGDSVNENSESYFLIRPFCNEFLREMAQFYEIVIFTAGVQDYADWVVD